MALYLSGVEELESAVAGLDASALDWSRAPGAWGVRQIVHHIADGDTLFLLPMRMAIAEPGRTFVYNWPKDNASYGENLRYGERDIAPSLALLRAIRTHMLQLMHAVPDIWTRSIVDENGRVWNFERFIRLLTGHALEHVDEILKIRRMHALGV